MRALVADGRGGIELREVEEPAPEHDEAVVAIHAVSLNRGEVRALAKAREGWRPGCDVAGVVVSTAADGSGPPEGSRVLALAREASWAEQAAVPTENMTLAPEGLDLARAATLPVAGLTAFRALHAGGVALDERVLVTGASGGVGRFAIQLAAHDGARVTAVARRPGREGDLERLGASRVVAGMPEDGAFDLILESVGGSSLAAALALVASGGTVVSYGNSSREPTTFDAGSFFSKSGARLYAFSLFPELERIGSGALDLAHLAVLAASRRLETSVELEVSWREASSAIAALVERRVSGKVVLTVD